MNFERGLEDQKQIATDKLSAKTLSVYGTRHFRCAQSQNVLSFPSRKAPLDNSFMDFRRVSNAEPIVQTLYKSVMPGLSRE
jgi:hypothetical protein